MNGLVDRQAKLGKTDDPVLKVVELERKIKELETEVAKLAKKKVPRKKSKPASSTTTTSAGEGEASSTIGSDEPTLTASASGEQHKKDEL